MNALYIYESPAGKVGFSTSPEATTIEVSPTSTVRIDGSWEIVDELNTRGEIGDLADYFSGDTLESATRELEVIVDRAAVVAKREVREDREKIEAAQIEKEKKEKLSARRIREIEKMNRDMANMGKLLARYGYYV